jgi:hypothetical protein
MTGRICMSYCEEWFKQADLDLAVMFVHTHTPQPKKNYHLTASISCHTEPYTNNLSGFFYDEYIVFALQKM